MAHRYRLDFRFSITSDAGEGFKLLGGEVRGSLSLEIPNDHSATKHVLLTWRALGRAGFTKCALEMYRLEDSDRDEEPVLIAAASD